jgi:hypothetical protein
MTGAWELLVRGAEVLRPFQPYVIVATCISFKIVGMARSLARDHRRVDIVVVNIATGERRRIVALPASKVTRAEVLGTLRLAAGGRLLDTSQTSLLAQDFITVADEVVVELPPGDFAHIAG